MAEPAESWILLENRPPPLGSAKPYLAKGSPKISARTTNARAAELRFISTLQYFGPELVGRRKMDIVLGSLFSMIADGLGAVLGGVWSASRQVRAIGSNIACPQCDIAFTVRPRIYRSTRYPVQTSWRTPSIIAEYKCADCGQTSGYHFTGTGLSLIDTREDDEHQQPRPIAK